MRGHSFAFVSKAENVTTVTALFKVWKKKNALMLGIDRSLNLE